ncbi:tetratricopeptide repeat protein [Streptacidiphilus monticola]
MPAVAVDGVRHGAAVAGDLKSARGHHEQALALFQASDEGLNRAEALNNLGETLQALAEPGRALPLHREALELAETAGDPVETARSRELLGRALLDLGHDQEENRS